MGQGGRSGREAAVVERTRLRVSEVVRLRPEDLDEERRLIRVRYGKGEGSLHVAFGGSASGRAGIPGSVQARGVAFSGADAGKTFECPYGTEGVRAGAGAGRHSAAGNGAYLTAQLCHSSAGSRDRPAVHPGAPGTQ